VGLLGGVAYEDIPRTAMDYLTIAVTGLLVLALVYILYQICFAKTEDDLNDPRAIESRRL